MTTTAALARLGFADTLRGAAEQAREALSSDDDHPDALGTTSAARTLLDGVRDHDPDWIAIGAGVWDHQGRPSWVRLDRVLDVPEDGIRREGAILPRELFDRVAHRLVREYHWS